MLVLIISLLSTTSYAPELSSSSRACMDCEKEFNEDDFKMVARKLTGEVKGAICSECRQRWHKEYNVPQFQRQEIPPTNMEIIAIPPINMEIIFMEHTLPRRAFMQRLGVICVDL